MLGVAGLAITIILVRILAAALPLAATEPPDGDLLPAGVREPSNQQSTKDPTEHPARPESQPPAGVAPNKMRIPRQKTMLKELVEINSADTIRLLDLTGIGPAFARRIVKYRDMLGGFALKEQLLQVYGMDSARFLGFVSEITVDTSQIRRLNVNEAPFKELLRHPYLDFDQVKALCNYRDRKGEIYNLSELWTAGILPDTLEKWIEPYLKTH
jgi:DNA uptake protein ComE-like DNA-binding protein